MAEWHEARVAEQQIEAGREHREDQNVGSKKGVVARPEHRDQRRHEEEQERPRDALGECRPGLHFTGLPNRPHGRKISTTAMITNAAKIENLGKIRMPK